MRLAFAIALCATLAPPAMGATWLGVQCMSSDCPNGGPMAPIANALILGAKIIRIRVGVPHPITDVTAHNQTYVVNVDVDPLGPSPSAFTLVCAPNPTACPMAISTTDALTSDVFPSGAAVFSVTAGPPIHITTTNPTSQYINSNVSDLALVSAAQAAGILVDATVLNRDSPSGSGSGPILDNPSAFQSRLAFLRSQILQTGLPGAVPPVIWTIENEEDSGNTVGTCLGSCTPPHNGDSSTLPQIQLKFQAAVSAFSATEPVSGSGYTTLAYNLRYWYSRFYGPPGSVPPITPPPEGGPAGECGTTSCQQAMDIFAQSAFPKGTSLPNSCNPTAALTQLPFIEKVETLLDGEALLATGYLNLHWYQVPPATELAPFAWMLAKVSGKYLVFNEVGTYSQSGADVVAALDAVTSLNAFEGIWWNEESADYASSTSQHYAVSLQDPTTGLLQPNGNAFKSYVATPTPPAGLGAPHVAAFPPC